MSLRGNMPAHSGGLSGSTVPCGNMIKPTMIMMTVIMIAIAMMSMMIRAKMHLVPKLSCLDELSVGNDHRQYPKFQR